MHIIGHWNVHIISIVVPIQSYTTVQFSFSTYFHFIEVFQRIYQMMGILLANVSNSKIIYYQREPNRSCIVLEKAWCVGLSRCIHIWLVAPWGVYWIGSLITEVHTYPFWFPCTHIQHLWNHTWLCHQDRTSQWVLVGLGRFALACIRICQEASWDKSFKHLHTHT